MNVCSEVISEKSTGSISEVVNDTVGAALAKLITVCQCTSVNVGPVAFEYEVQPDETSGFIRSLISGSSATRLRTKR